MGRKKTMPMPENRIRRAQPEEPQVRAQGPGGEVAIYQDPGRQVRVDVRLEQDTLWLNLNQMATLFERDKSVISRHLRNIFREGELDREATVAFFATVQDEGGRQVVRSIEYYNLDAILSVGYRVNSKRGTQFRIWATQVLRDHLVQGYTVHQRRLAELRKTIQVLASIPERRALAGNQAAALLHLLHEYSHALSLLDDYDHGRLPSVHCEPETAAPISLEEALRLVESLRAQFGGNDLFGRLQGHGLDSALAAIFQTAGGKEVYPTRAEKAAHLLYFVVKNHPFVDGNKRIGAALFLWFLEKNGALHLPDGRRRFSEEALVALTLLVAESDPRDKETIIQLIAALFQQPHWRERTQP